MRRLVAALVAAALSVGWSGAYASGQPARLTVTATGSQRGVLTVKESIAIDSGDWTRALPANTVSTSSPYAGIVISRGQRVVFGLYVDRALPYPLTFGQQQPRLTPGRYDVTVFTASRAVVRLPLSGSDRSYNVRLATKVSGSRSVTDAGSIAAAPAAYTSVPTTVTAGSMTLVAFTATALADNATNDTVCLTTQPLPCELGSVQSGNSTGTQLISTAAGKDEVAMFVYPGDVAAGHYYATADHEAVGLQQSAQLVVVSF